LTEEKLEITLVFLRGIQKKTLKEEWLFVSQVQLPHATFKAGLYLKKKKVVVIHRSIIIIVHSFTYNNDVTGICQKV
jgi:hypothetical protein